MPPRRAAKPRRSGFPNKKKELNLQERSAENTLFYYPHYCIPGINFNKTPRVEKWDLGNVMDMYKSYPYSSDLPKPLLPPSKNTKCLLTMSDPVTDILFTKSIIQDDIDRILDNYQKHQTDHQFMMKKDLQWTTEGDKKETILPRYLADLSDIIQMDPDPLFQGEYNWYYTGGSLTGLTLNNQFILIFPYMNELVTMPLSYGNNFIWKPDYKNASKLSLDNTVYELRYKTSSTCQILARLKNECTLLSLSENNGKLQLIPFDTKSSTIPFISADLPPNDSNQYCTLDANQTMEVCDITTGKVISKGDIKLNQKLDDNWGSVKYNLLNPDLLIYTNRCCLYYFDTRAEMDGPVLSMCPKSYLEHCERISLQLFSTRESRLYLGTSHSILLCDDRTPTECVHQKWTHQLKSTPLQGSVADYGDQEIVLMSGQVCTDKSVIINSWNDYPHSYYLPKVPPSISDTLKKCQSLGKCLDPLLTPRFQLSTAGVHLKVTEDNNAFIFSQNSIGDIFYQCITHDKNSERMPFYNSQAQYALNCWERQILLQDDPLLPFVLCDRVNMEDALNTFSNAELKYSIKPKEESYVPEYWRQPLEKLKSYVDLLAPELLAVWEMKDELEDGTSSNQHEKVLNWLEMADEEEIPESQPIFDDDDEDSFPFTPIESQELVSVSQQHFERNVPIEIPNENKAESIQEVTQNDFNPEDLYLPAVKVKTKTKTVQRKSGFIDGFQ
ncbi:uncharacterized protein TAF1C-like [Chelonus insularis]|uniref:uncharacterized protein TAF1C-like n=1 Tax=Chelonus insularis TaxID=460826 RepID=UPI0015894A21|nr:uncharacterized protein LOC118064932 [Chelonus insularis]